MKALLLCWQSSPDAWVLPVGYCIKHSYSSFLDPLLDSYRANTESYTTGRSFSRCRMIHSTPNSSLRSLEGTYARQLHFLKVVLLNLSHGLCYTSSLTAEVVSLLTAPRQCSVVLHGTSGKHEPWKTSCSLFLAVQRGLVLPCCVIPCGEGLYKTLWRVSKL